MATPKQKTTFAPAGGHGAPVTPGQRKAFAPAGGQVAPVSPVLRKTFMPSFTAAAVSPTLLKTMFGSGDGPIPIFCYRPNWQQPIAERLEWKTDILKSYKNDEQRIQIRGNPRRFFEFSILLERWQLPQFEALLFGWQPFDFYLPIWTDGERLSAGLSAGATTINCSTAHREYQDGGRVIIMAADDGEAAYGTAFGFSEIVDIATVGSGVLNLASSVLSSYSIGAWIAPVRDARATQSVSLARDCQDVISARLEFELTEDYRIPAAPSGLTMYQGIDVFEMAINRREGIDETFSRSWDRLDNDTGLSLLEARNDRPNISASRLMLLDGRAEIEAFREWLHYRKGQLEPFFSPSENHDLDLHGAIENGNPVLSIKDIGFRFYYARNLHETPGTQAYINEARRDLAIIKRDGSGSYYRRIVAAQRGGVAGTEVLTLDNSIGEDLNPEDVLVFFLNPVRLASDSVTLEWLTDSVVEVSFETRSM